MKRGMNRWKYITVMTGLGYYTDDLGDSSQRTDINIEVRNQNEA